MPKSLTQEEFINKASIVHNNFYDYSKTVYTYNKTKVCIICPNHGEFWQIPANHLFGKGCFLCGRKSRSLIQEDFINKSINIHGDRFNYSKVIYRNSEEKVCIICPNHGEFWQSPNNHMQGRGCPHCGRLDSIKHKILNMNIFIKRSIAIHGDKYNYSKVNYKGSKIKVCITCPIHGDFYQRPPDHLVGYGCKKCSVDSRRLSSKDFILKANNIHGEGKYDYSKIKYVNSFSKVCITCPIHGDFWQVAETHLSGFNCPKCASLNTAKRLTITNEEFIKRAFNKHGDRYDYSKVDYKRSKTKVCIICKSHEKFYQTPSDHLNSHGCPKCGRSKGENEIEDWLKKNKINFYTQYIFNDLKGVGKFRKRSLFFDFYIPHKNLLIEFDGEQHFRPVQFNGISLEKALKNFKRDQQRDILKNEYCLKNNISLLRVSYKDIKSIPNILESFGIRCSGENI